MKYVWTTIMVKNMEESLAFYQEVLGLKLNRRFSPNPNMDLAFLGEGDAEVELIYDANLTALEFGRHISMGFMSKEPLDKMIENLSQRGITIQDGPYQPNPMLKYLFILDPNGVRIQLIEDLRP